MRSILIALFILSSLLYSCKKYEILETFPDSFAPSMDTNFRFNENLRNCEILYSSEEITNTFALADYKNELSKKILVKAANVINEVNPRINLKPTPLLTSANIRFEDQNLSVLEPYSLTNGGRIFNANSTGNCANCLVFNSLTPHATLIKISVMSSEDARLQSYVYYLGKYLGLKDSNDKESWMYPFYVPDIQKKFKENELIRLQTYSNLCDEKNVVSAKILSVSSEGNAEIQVDYSHPDVYPALKVGVLVAEDTSSLYLEKGTYYIKSTTTNSDAIKFTTDVLNANQRFYVKAFLYGKSGVVYESKITPVVIPDRAHNKWVGLSREKLIMPTYGTPSYAYNNIVYTKPIRTYDYKSLFGFFENGSYMEMTNPLLAGDDKCFFDDGKLYMYQEHITTQSLSIYEYDLNSYKTQVININYADYGLKNTNPDGGSIVFAAEGYIYLMNQSIGYFNTGEVSTINLLRINMNTKAISKLKSLNTSAFRSMYRKQLYAFTNGNKIYFDIYNATFFERSGYTMTINKEDFQLVQSELLPIKPNLSKYQNLTDSPSNLLNLRAFSVSSSGKMYRLLSTDFRVEPSIATLLKNSSLSGTFDVSKVMNRAWPMFIPVTKETESRPIQLFETFDIDNRLSKSLCIPPKGIEDTFKYENYEEYAPKYDLVDGKDKMYLFVYHSYTSAYSSIWIYYK